jgi:hypothetical protein
MKYLILVLALAELSLLAAQPVELSFHLELTYMQELGGNLLLGGDFAITNTSASTWSYTFVYPQIGLIWLDEQEPPFYYFDWPTTVVIPPQETFVAEIGGGGVPCGPGLHIARSRLFYTPFDQIPVGNWVTLSTDSLRTEIADLDWQLQLGEVGPDYLTANLILFNDSVYAWQRQFPYATVALLAVDGNFNPFTPDPDPHLEYLAPHQHRTLDLLHYNQVDGTVTDFLPGDHSVQAWVLTPEPVAVGDPVAFHVQGSVTDDSLAPPLSLDFCPNPCSGEGWLRIKSPVAQSCRIDLFNLRGQLLSSHPLPRLAKGLTEIPWNDLAPSGLPSGVYLLRVRSGIFANSAKVLLVR